VPEKLREKPRSIPHVHNVQLPLLEGKKGKTMAERLGLGVLPGVGWSAREIQTIARQAEEAGFDAICAAEANNDVMATVQLMGTATSRITVATWIANIYLRHLYVFAQGAACIADLRPMHGFQAATDDHVWAADRHRTDASHRPPSVKYHFNRTCPRKNHESGLTESGLNSIMESF
jgi:hypothetical protein